MEEITRNACPLPPCRMLRPSVPVVWNPLKGVVDEYSRYMKSFTMAGTAEDPTVTMISRLLLTQPANAALVYRLIQKNNQVCSFQTGSRAIEVAIID